MVRSAATSEQNAVETRRVVDDVDDSNLARATVHGSPDSVYQQFEGIACTPAGSCSAV